MAPIVHGLEAKYGDQMNFIYLNIDDPQTEPFKTTLDYFVQPHFFLVDEQGNVLRQWLGYVQQEELDAFIQGALNR